MHGHLSTPDAGEAWKFRRGGGAALQRESIADAVVLEIDLPPLAPRDGRTFAEATFRRRPASDFQRNRRAEKDSTARESRSARGRPGFESG
jgi:hypothetical protein